MTRANDESARLLPAPEGEDWALYESVGGMLLHALTSKFGLPADRAQLLVYETFIMLFQSDCKPSDRKAWLVNTACTRAKEDLRSRDLPVPPDAERLEAALVMRDATQALTARGREALRLKFHERKTDQEIAEELGISVFAAKRLVFKAFAKLRAMRADKARQPQREPQPPPPPPVRESTAAESRDARGSRRIVTDDAFRECLLALGTSPEIEEVVQALVLRATSRPERARPIPGSDLRVLRSRSYGPYPALRLFYEFDDAEVRLRWIEEWDELETGR